MKTYITKLHPDVVLPEYQTTHSAGQDVRAHIAIPQTLQPMQRAMIPTGLAIAVPEGYELQIRARSGLAAKNGICLTNGVGTIDADYRGELKILLINLGTEPFTIEPGMRIAQMVLSAYERIEWSEVLTLPESVRGNGGFGSTGR